MNEKPKQSNLVETFIARVRKLETTIVEGEQKIVNLTTEVNAARHKLAEITQACGMPAPAAPPDFSRGVLMAPGWGPEAPDLRRPVYHHRKLGDLAMRVIEVLKVAPKPMTAERIKKILRYRGKRIDWRVRSLVERTAVSAVAKRLGGKVVRIPTGMPYSRREGGGRNPEFVYAWVPNGPGPRIPLVPAPPKAKVKPARPTAAKPTGGKRTFRNGKLKTAIIDMLKNRDAMTRRSIADTLMRYSAFACLPRHRVLQSVTRSLEQMLKNDYRLVMRVGPDRESLYGYRFSKKEAIKKPAPFKLEQSAPSTRDMIISVLKDATNGETRTMTCGEIKAAVSEKFGVTLTTDTVSPRLYSLRKSPNTRIAATPTGKVLDGVGVPTLAYSYLPPAALEG